MNFDPQIVAQAQAFVKGFNSGRGVRVPKMTFSSWRCSHEQQNRAAASRRCGVTGGS